MKSNPHTAPEDRITRQPFFCPVCGGLDVRRILDNAAVRTNPEATAEAVTGLSGYICHQGHVFFVRSCDLELWSDEAEFP